MRLTRVQNALKEKISHFNIRKKMDAEVWILNFGDCVTTCGNMKKIVHGARRRIYLRQAEAGI